MLWKHGLARVGPGGLLLALFAFAAVVLTLRRGMPCGLDGWFYWQGSVSLLKGLGYRDFTGRPITDWPPLYSAYLALCQLALGVSVRTVVLATALATGAAVAGWSVLLAWYARERGRAPREALLGLAFVAILLALSARSLRSETLYHAVFPLLLWFTLRAGVSAEPRHLLRDAALAGGALLVALLIRNASLAFWPAVLAVILRNARVSWRARLVACALVTLLALPAWLGMLAWFGQLGSHPLRLGGRIGFVADLAKFVSGLDRNTGLRLLGLPLLVLLAGALLHADPKRGGAQTPAGLGRAALLFTLAAAGATLALFNLTVLYDRPEGRFTLFATLALGGLGLIDLPRLLGRRWLLLATLLLFAEPALRLAKNGIRGPGAYDYRAQALEEFAPGPATIDPEFVRRPPEASGGRVRISPPYPTRIRFEG